MTPRLFIAELPRQVPALLRLSGADHHYLTRVLRKGLGDTLTLIQTGQRVATAHIVALWPDALTVQVDEVRPARPEVGPRLTLLMGLLKGDKLDGVVQKATELGAVAVVPMSCARSVPRMTEQAAADRQRRWARIAQSAAQQCGRKDLPHIGPLTPFEDALRATTAELRLLMWEKIGDATVAQALPQSGATPLSQTLPTEVAILVGPEGGLTQQEVDLACAAGFVPCGLGSRVLRAETAALAALVLVDYLCRGPVLE